MLGSFGLPSRPCRHTFEATKFRCTCNSQSVWCDLKVGQYSKKLWHLSHQNNVVVSRSRRQRLLRYAIKILPALLKYVDDHDYLMLCGEFKVNFKCKIFLFPHLPEKTKTISSAKYQEEARVKHQEIQKQLLRMSCVSSRIKRPCTSYFV